MIKVEVIIDGTYLKVGLWVIDETTKNSYSYFATKNGKDLEYFYNVRAAIKYCMEN